MVVLADEVLDIRPNHRILGDIKPESRIPQGLGVAKEQRGIFGGEVTKRRPKKNLQRSPPPRYVFREELPKPDVPAGLDP